MYVRIWEYDVVEGETREFERMYGPEGDWARLFHAADGFLGTELYERVGEPRRYVTVDRFTSEVAWQRFLTTHRAAYDDLDREAARTTLREQELAATEQP